MKALAVLCNAEPRAAQLEIVGRAALARIDRLAGVLRRMERVERLQPVRVLGRRVHGGLTTEGIRDVREDDASAPVARGREVLLGTDQHVAVGDATGPGRAVERAKRVVHEPRLRLVDAADEPPGHEDRIPGLRLADDVHERVAMAAAGREAADPAAPADPRYAVGVHLHVVRVVGEAVVAPEVDRLAKHPRPRGVPEVRDPDRPAVAAPAGGEWPEEGEIVAPGGPAGPDVPTALDAAGRVPGGQLNEVADLPEAAWIPVQDCRRVRGHPARARRREHPGGARPAAALADGGLLCGRRPR